MGNPFNFRGLFPVFIHLPGAISGGFPGVVGGIGGVFVAFRIIGCENPGTTYQTKKDTGMKKTSKWIDRIEVAAALVALLIGMGITNARADEVCKALHLLEPDKVRGVTIDLELRDVLITKTGVVWTLRETNAKNENEWLSISAHDYRTVIAYYCNTRVLSVE